MWRVWEISSEISPDGQKALAVDADGAVIVWTLANTNRLDSFNEGGPRLNETHFSRDSKAVIAAASDNSIHVWNTIPGKEQFILVEEKFGGDSFDITGPVDMSPGAIVKTGFLCVKSSPDGNLIAAANEFGRICIWDARTKKQLLHLTGHIGRIKSVTFSPDGNYLLTVGEDTKVFLWDIHSTKKVDFARLHVLESAEAITSM